MSEVSSSQEIYISASLDFQLSDGILQDAKVMKNLRRPTEEYLRTIEWFLKTYLKNFGAKNIKTSYLKPYNQEKGSLDRLGLVFDFEISETNFDKLEEKLSQINPKIFLGVYEK